MIKESTVSVTLPATVNKVIKSPIPDEPIKAEITVQGADPLYRELRIENSLQNDKGEEVSLKPGAEVHVTIEAHGESSISKTTP